MTAWTSIYSSNRALEGQQDNAEAARVALDRAARQLRNLANPTVNAITTIDRATDYDFIFQTSDPSKTWVRYCLQTSGGGNTVGDATLWESESAAAITRQRCAPPARATAGQRQHAVVEGVTNQAGGIDRNIFDYECSLKSAATCPVDTTEYSKITNVGIELWVDADNTDRVSELNVATGVFLRNQNEAPTVSASARPRRRDRAGPAQRLGLQRPRGPHARVLLVRGHGPDRRAARRDRLHRQAAGSGVGGRDVLQALRRRRRPARSRPSTCSCATRAASPPCPRKNVTVPSVL